MSSTAVLEKTLAFLGAALAREGADVEPCGAGALFTLLPQPVSAALSLPGAVTLRVEGEPGQDEAPCPLEGSAVQWLADRARARGRLAGARLPARCGPALRRVEATRERVSLLNATLADATAVFSTDPVIVVEFAYEARSEERTDGSVAVAVPSEGGPPSTALAEAILQALPGAEAESPSLDAAHLVRAFASATPLAQAAIRRSLAPFLADRARRMAVERERVIKYHERLSREAGHARGRGSAVSAEAVASKRAAVLRARDERLADVAERHAVEATITLDGVLEATYPAVHVRLLIRRRRREVEALVRWDPFLTEPTGPACASCAHPTLSIHVCDDAGHLTCAACARACPACARVLCRTCVPTGCGCA